MFTYFYFFFTYQSDYNFTMSVSFEIAKTLHGSPDERFIQLKAFPHKISSSDPDTKWSPGFLQNPDVKSDLEKFLPISVQVGSKQFWYFETDWGLFEFPNKKVSDLIEEKLINKYGVGNIITHKYLYKSNSEGTEKAFLFVIRCSALIAVYSTIILASEISRKFINTDKLYIGVRNDENLKTNLITDNGIVKHYYPFPNKFKKVSEIFDLKNQKDLFKIKSIDYDVKYIQGIESANEDSFTLNDEYSKKFGYIINGILDKNSREDVLYFNKYKEILKSCQDETGLSISLTSRNKDGVLIEHNLDTIIKNIEEAESKVLKLSN